MKKIPVTLLLLGFSVAAVAGGIEAIAPPSPVSNCFSGLYVGAGIGAGLANFNTSTSTVFKEVSLGDPDLIYRASQTFRGRSNNVLGALFVGYGFSFSQFYLGGEVYGTATNLKNNSELSTSIVADPTVLNGNFLNTTQVRLNNLEGGIDGRVGFLFTPTTMIYAKVGVAFNKIKLNSNNNLQDLTDTPLPNEILNYQRTRSVGALRFGGGLEQCLSNNFSIRADYTYTNYGSINGHATGIFNPDIETTDTLDNITSSRVSSNTFLLSAIYHFA